MTKIVIPNVGFASTIVKNFFTKFKKYPAVVGNMSVLKIKRA